MDHNFFLDNYIFIHNLFKNIDLDFDDDYDVINDNFNKVVFKQIKISLFQQNFHNHQVIYQTLDLLKLKNLNFHINFSILM